METTERQQHHQPQPTFARIPTVTDSDSSSREHSSNSAGVDETFGIQQQQQQQPHQVDARIAEERIQKGQCPSCGQQLFKLKVKSKKGILRRLKKNSSSGSNSSSSNSSSSNNNNKNVTRVPLNVTGRVARGQCLQCCAANNDESQNHPTVTAEATTDDTDTAMMEQVPTAPSVMLETTNNDDAMMIQQQWNTNAANTAVYRGPFNAYGERHGMGEMTWSNNGDIYRGDFFNGNRHGHGTLTFGDGSEYVGSWECNYMHGTGTRRFPNGDVYMGDYVNGKRHGQGRFYFSNGDMYIGSWHDDSMSGFGRYYYSCGQRFEGTFWNGKRHGKGKLQRVDGDLDIYRYCNDQRDGVGVRWSADRTKAWRLEPGRAKKKITIAEAVSLVYEIERTAAVSHNESTTLLP